MPLKCTSFNPTSKDMILIMACFFLANSYMVFEGVGDKMDSNLNFELKVIIACIQERRVIINIVKKNRLMIFFKTKNTKLNNLLHKTPNNN